MYARVNSRVIHSSQKVAAAQVPTDTWLDKQNVVNLYSGIFSVKKGILFLLLLSLKNRKEILTHAITWMNLEDLMLSEISPTQKDRYCVTPFR